MWTRERWISFGVVALIVGVLGLAMVAGIKQVEKERANATHETAWRAAQEEWQRQQLQATQALAEEVRRLREAVEGRER